MSVVFISIENNNDIPTDFRYATGNIIARVDTLSIILYSRHYSTIAVNSWNVNKWTGWETTIRTSDLGNSSFWFPENILPWGNYNNGTYQLTQSILSKPISVRVGINGKLSSFWHRTQANDDRTIVIPDGAINIHFDSDIQITISGATELWEVRSITTF